MLVLYVGESPLGPFHLAKNNPYSYKPGGFINGAGHGSTLEDKEGRYWHTSTMRISRIYTMERRVGLWKAGFDEDGELYCDQRFGDWPIRMDAEPFAKSDWMLLSYGKPVTVSSGSGAEYITDENVRTWWTADGKEEGARVRYLRLTVRELPYQAAPSVSGIRIFGKGNGRIPEKTSDVQIERITDLDIEVSWKADDAVCEGGFL